MTGGLLGGEQLVGAMEIQIGMEVARVRHVACVGWLRKDGWMWSRMLLELVGLTTEKRENGVGLF